MKPDFKNMSIAEATDLFNQIRHDLILYLSSLGLSQREISRRIGGSSVHAVNNVLNK
jgi:hypothetical protein